jgi:glycosyltransferase involved in cell wall biosynthesis
MTSAGLQPRRSLRVIHFATTSVMHKAFNLPLARYQRDRGMVVEFGCGEDIPAGYVSAQAELAADGFRVHVVPFPYAIRPLADLAALARLTWFFRRNRFDVVHTHTSKAGVLVRLAARLAGCPFVAHTVHDLHFREFPRGPRRRAFTWIERRMAGLSDVLFFTTPVLRDLAAAERIHGHRPSVLAGAPLRELSWFSATDADSEGLKRELGLGTGPIVACVARLVSFKGIDTLLHTARLVLDEIPEARFVILGGGPLESELRAEADGLGVSTRVIFTGFRTEDRDVLRLLRLADVFCLPTRREGLGIAFVEAMAMAVPVVGPRTPPITTVVADGETGFLIAPEDAAAYATAILQLLRDPDLRRRMGEAGRRRVEALYDPRRAFETITATYPA